MNIYVRKVASEGINHHVEHCIFVPASRVLFSSRCPTFRVSLLSSTFTPRWGVSSLAGDPHLARAPYYLYNVFSFGKGSDTHTHKTKKAESALY